MQKGVVAFVPEASEGPKKITGQRKEEIREDEKSIKTKGRKGQDREGPQQFSAGVRGSTAFLPLYACILLSSLLQLNRNTLLS